jgi:Mlc titration factor MtfA (ptsG expression regulator)
MNDWLTKDERMQMHQMREDYIEIFHTKTELRDENPELWHTIVDQWEAIKFRLEQDEHEKCMSTATHTLDDIMGDEDA